MEEQKKAYLYAIIAVIFWSTVATAFKLSLRYIDFVQLLFYSSLTSLIVLLSILILSGKFNLLLRSSYRDVLRSLIMGFLNPFLYYLVLFKAYSLLRAQEAQPLNYTWPIVLVFLSAVVLKQRVRSLDWIGLLVGFFGVIIISNRGDLLSLRPTDPIGVMLAVGSSLIWSTFWILNMQDRRDDVVKLFMNFLFGFLFVSIVFLAFSNIDWNIYGLIGAIYTGIFEMGITFVIWLKALNLSKATALISNLIFLSPFISLMFIHFILGEEILPSTLIGLLMIVSGILIQRR